MLTDPDAIIRAELQDGEQLLWAGRPRLGIFLRPIDALLIPFSLLWGGFAIFWEIGVIRSGAPSFFALFGIPFVAMGMYLIVGRFFWDSWRRGRTFYGVTSERVVIVSGLSNRQTKSLNLRSISDVSMTESSSGGGTITLGPQSMMSAWNNPGAGWPGWGPAVQAFELERDVRDVFKLICDAQRARN